MHPVEKFISSNYQRLRRYSLRVADFDEARSEDLLHNIIFDALRRKDEWPTGDVWKWFIVTIKQENINSKYRFYKNKKVRGPRHVYVGDAVSVFDAPTFNGFTDPYILDHFNIVLSSLDPVNRSIIDMRINKSMSFSEIASELGLTIPSVKSAFGRLNVIIAEDFNTRFRLNKKLPYSSYSRNKPTYTFYSNRQDKRSRFAEQIQKTINQNQSQQTTFS